MPASAMSPQPLGIWAALNAPKVSSADMISSARSWLLASSSSSTVDITRSRPWTPPSLLRKAK